MSINRVTITTPECYHDVHVHWTDRQGMPQHSVIRVLRTCSKNDEHLEFTINGAVVARSYPK